MKTAMTAMTRGAAALALAFSALLLAASPARADEAAEAYMRAVFAEANEVLKAPDQQTRFAGIDALVDKHVDMRRVAMFALGQYARVITDAQREEYFPLFREYAKLVYRDALSEYSNQRLEVTNSVARSPRDIIVNSRIADARPGDPYANSVIHWRVYRNDRGEQSVFDAGLDGVWLAIEQQSQFKSVIANNGGGVRGIDALIADLRRKVQG